MTIFGFGIHRTGRRAWIFGTPWGWLEFAWVNEREEREAMEVWHRELTQPCAIEREVHGIDVYGRPVKRDT